MATQLKLFTPPGLQRYDCAGCGACCRGRFGINLSDDEVTRIRNQNWTDEELDLKGKPLFTQHADGAHLAHREDGSCVFLDSDARCKIHSKFGASAKPVSCRLYPFKLIPIGNQVRVDIRFDCPSVASNRGVPIPSYREDLSSLLKIIAAKRDTASPAPPLYGTHPTTWARLIRITDAFERVLWDVSLDLTRRITACINLSALLRNAKIAALDGKELSDVLDEAVSSVQQTASGDTLARHSPNGIERAIFRQTLYIHSRYDHVGDRETTFSRLGTTFRMIRGRGAVPMISSGFPRVSFEDMEASTGVPTPAIAEAVERYLHIHLTSMGFFGSAYYQRSYLDGLNALLLTYPLIFWFARVFAAEAGLSAPDSRCVERALMIVDHQHGITPSMNMQGGSSRTSFLHDRAILRSFVIWYGS